jgi:Ca2+:H+ antiporter
MVHWGRLTTWKTLAGSLLTLCLNWLSRARGAWSAGGQATSTDRRVRVATPKQTFQLSSFLNLNLLLVFLPVALLARVQQGSDVLIFIASGLAIIPLSGLIGEATEALSGRLGQRIGGLINATLGNAAELIITIFALRAGLTELVKASIVGSILGNLLLVTGTSFVLGGLRHGLQTFERRTASMNATLVILAFLVLAVPSGFDVALQGSGDSAQARELFFSEGIALVVIVLYAFSVIYTLRDPQARLGYIGEESLSEQHVNMRRALITLALATLGIVLMSETLVGTVEPVAQGLGLSQFFIGIIIVPLIGNVAEHIVAVRVAVKNRMDLSLSISLGSSLQIALFVTPVLVFVSLLFPQKLLLVFNAYELLALATASIVAALVSQDGESNWLEGAQLLAVYIILALAFFLLPSIGASVPH